jgi:very-short-patch-repair endonuclease
MSMPDISEVNMTDAENRLWSCLCSSPLGSDTFHPQYVIGNYTVDFCSPQHKLIIEVDDPQTLEHDEFYVIRNAWLEAAGWRLLRFTSHDTLKNTNGVLSVILAVVRKGDKSVSRLAGKSLAEMLDFEI